MSDLKTNSRRLFGMIIDKGRNLGAVGQTADKSCVPRFAAKLLQLLHRFMYRAWPLLSDIWTAMTLLIKNSIWRLCAGRDFSSCVETWLEMRANRTVHSHDNMPLKLGDSFGSRYAVFFLILFWFWLPDCSCIKTGVNKSRVLGRHGDWTLYAST